jgi:gluconokinase
MIAILMGVAGSGKTTLGRALAERLGWTFVEGDAFHPPQNVAKMAEGTPLADADRAPWLSAIRAHLEVLHAEGRSAVLACSALKAAYRDALARGLPARFVWLDVPPQVLAQRLGAREGHFAGEDLLASQIAALEPPASALRLDGTLPLAALTQQAAEALESQRGGVGEGEKG